MRCGVVLVLAAWLACDARSRSDQADGYAGLAPHDSVDSVLAMPRVVDAPTVVVFWLAASDTLHPDDAATAYDEITLAAEAIVEALAAYDIALLPTHADTVFLALPNRQRRTIMLSGLEFPFGFVLVEPGGAERILAGVYGEAELLDEIRVYFDLPEDSTRVSPPRVTTE
jgi:hypothetical protein